MLPNNNFGLVAGCFTDDTSMTLCLAHSLLECNGQSNMVGEVRKYISWWKEGYMSVVDKCFDIGVSTRSALADWENLLNAEYNGLHPDSQAAEEALFAIEKKMKDRYSKENCCGNGSLMRVLPCALIAPSEPEVVQLAQESSMTTHPHPRCAHACMIYSALVHQVLNGASKSELAISLGESVNMTPSNISDTPIEPIIKERLGGYRRLADWEARSSESIRSTGYVVDTLEAVLWSFFTTTSFEDAAIRAVNLGDDADTVGAICGGLAGAFYGVETIPEAWLGEMKRMELLEDVAKKILDFRAKSV